MRVRKVCQQCGKEFEFLFNKTNPGRRKYCSIQCRYDSQKGSKKVRIEKICENCGKHFFWADSGSNSTGKYCSNKCRLEKGAHYTGGHKIPCDFCGQLVYKAPYMLREKNHFCGCACHIRYQWEHQFDEIIKGHFKKYKLARIFAPPEIMDKIIRAKILQSKIRRSLNV